MSVTSVCDLPSEILGAVLNRFSQKEQGQWLTCCHLFEQVITANLNIHKSLEFTLTTEPNPLYAFPRRGYENKNLIVHGYTHINDASFKQLIQKFSCLTELNLELCRTLSPHTIIEVLSSLKGLEILNIAHISRGFDDEEDERIQFTDNDFLQIAKKFPRLKKLNLSGTHISGKALVEMARGCATLATLKIAHCENISDGDLLKVCEILSSSLTSLDISELTVPNPTLAKMVESLTQLTKLHFLSSQYSEDEIAQPMAIPFTTLEKLPAQLEVMKIS